MVRAILAGAKTQTRRVCKAAALKGGTDFRDADGWPMRHDIGCGDVRAGCPYGAVGDRLFVRETYFAFGRWETRFSVTKGRDEWHFIDMAAAAREDYLYAADGVSNTGAFIKRRTDPRPMHWQRPSIFMPRWVSRITLELTGVRVERLQTISDADAIAEGISFSAPFGGYHTEDGRQFHCTDPIESYASLWEAINGAGSWDANPFVWCVSFRRIDTSTQREAA